MSCRKSRSTRGACPASAAMYSGVWPIYADHASALFASTFPYTSSSPGTLSLYIGTSTSIARKFCSYPLSRTLHPPPVLSRRTSAHIRHAFMFARAQSDPLSHTFPPLQVYFRRTAAYVLMRLKLVISLKLVMVHMLSRRAKKVSLSLPRPVCTPENGRT